MNILLVEDEPQLAELVKRALLQAGHTVGMAASGPSGLERITALHFDLLVLDVNLPGFDGFELLARVRAAGLPVRVLMLTARSEVGDRVAGLKAGADDYLTKPFALEELLARVEVLGRRAAVAEQETMIQTGGLCVDLAGRRISRGDRRIELSPREFQVFQVLIREPGRTFSRDEICERIWERAHEYDTRTVEIFIMRLRRKLDLPGEESIIRTVRNEGYRINLPS